VDMDTFRPAEGNKGNDILGKFISDRQDIWEGSI
jgi:hypothetical protein